MRLHEPFSHLSRCSAGYRAIGAVLNAAAAMRGETMVMEFENEANRSIAIAKENVKHKYTETNFSSCRLAR